MPMPPATCSRLEWVEFTLKRRRAEMEETAEAQGTAEEPDVPEDSDGN